MSFIVKADTKLFLLRMQRKRFGMQIAYLNKTIAPLDTPQRLMQIAFFSLQFHLHHAVAHVAYPAGQMQRSGQRLDKITESDS